MYRTQPMYRHADIYIGRYENVSYRQNSADIYQHYLLISVSETQVATSSLTLTN